jgi:hypothetical protein
MLNICDKKEKHHSNKKFILKKLLFNFNKDKKLLIFKEFNLLSKVTVKLFVKKKKLYKLFFINFKADNFSPLNIKKFDK